MPTKPLTLMLSMSLLAAACASSSPNAAGPASAGAPPAGGASAAESPAPPAKKPLSPDDTKQFLPAWSKGQNPFAGVNLKWVDPYAPAHLKSKLLSKTDPQTSALLAKVADNGGADWIGDWTPNVENWVRRRVTTISKAGSLPLFIAYNLPGRDCGQYSKGGATQADDYKKWITAFANGIGNRRAVVVLEPDSLGLLKKKGCMTEEQQKERLELIRFAVHTFEALGNTAVYMDAGHSGWLPAKEDAALLKEVGVEEAQGFALNVSNYKSTPEEIKYGKEISKLLGGKHFVIDTSRNGNGAPTDCKGPDDENCWCNPPGRALGSPPTAETSDKLVDAYLWLKKPAESDGACNGGPKAGDYWQDRALELSKNAKY
jgi:endoglucanase